MVFLSRLRIPKSATFRPFPIKRQAFRLGAPSDLVPRTSPPLSVTPCKLAYFRVCKCYQIQPYVHLNPKDPDGKNVKGSLDSLLGEGETLQDQWHDVGEVAVAADGLIYPDTGCES